MELRRLGGTDLEISPIGLGCMQFAGQGMVARWFYPALEQGTIDTIVRAALDGGITWFDTAEMYGGGRSESALTTALRAADREPGSVRIASKWAPLGRRASSITGTIERRLESLQGFPIDLHQIHMPVGGLSSHRAQLSAMVELHRAGRIGVIGVSNFSARQMRVAYDFLATQGIPLASNQIRLSLAHRHAERKGIVETAQRLGITLIAYSPLESGLLTGKFHEDPARARRLALFRRYAGGFGPRGLQRTRPLVDELRSIGQAYDVKPAQVALAWLLRHYGDTVVAIPGASKPNQARESAEAQELRLTERELQRLDDLSRRLS